MGYFGIPFRNGVPIGLGSVVSFGAQQFDPSELFVGGTAGTWYDPSDLTTMFTTAAGTTPVAMPGQGSAVSVGLMLDKSQGLVLGPELIANPDFTTDTWWLKDAGVTISGGTANWAATAATFQIYKTGILTVGALYKVTFTITSISSGGLRAVAGSGTSGSTRTTPGTYTEYLVAAGSGTVAIQSVGASTTASVDNVSYQALPGNHAIAFNDTTARPELRARVNLLVATATLSTQSVTTQATSYTLSFAGTGSITLSGTATGTYSAGTNTITCTAGTLTLTVSGTVTTADLRPANAGSLLPAYQAVTDANTYDTNGFPLYLLFEGAVGQRGMYTPANLDLSGTDKVAVFAGVRKNADVSIICELSASAGTNNGAFLLATGGWGAENGTYVRSSRGTATSFAQPATNSYPSPRTDVLTGTSDIAGDSVVLRISGTQAATSATDQGTGNYGTYPLYIGARNNSSLWLNGHIYSLAVVGSAVSGGNIAAMESWVAGRTGIQI